MEYARFRQAGPRMWRFPPGTMTRFSIVLFAALLMGFAISDARARTLGECLQRELPNADTTQLPHHDLDITSYGHGWNEDKSRFGIAYYLLDQGIPSLPAIVHIAVFDVHSTSWKFSELDKKKLKLMGGSIVSFRFFHERMYLGAHINPSAGTTWILDKNHDFIDEIYGSVLAVFPDDTVVFRNSQAHFVPTHHVTVSVRDGRTGETRKLYPLEPFQQARTKRMQKVREVYEGIGEDWFRINNHGMNPEWFQCYLQWDKTAQNDDSNAVAFAVRFLFEERLRFVLPFRYQFAKKLTHGFNVVSSSKTSDEFANRVLSRRDWFKTLQKELLEVAESDRREVLALFNNEPAIAALFQKAFDSPKTPVEVSYQEHFRRLDEAWLNPEIWKTIHRTACALTYTDVAVICRNIHDPDAYEYKELPLVEVNALLGASEPAEWLTAEHLARLFSH